MVRLVIWIYNILVNKLIQDIELKDKNANVFQVQERVLGMDTVLGSNATMVHALMHMTYVMVDLIAVKEKMKKYVSINLKM